MVIDDLTEFGLLVGGYSAFPNTGVKDREKCHRPIFLPPQETFTQVDRLSKLPLKERTLNMPGVGSEARATEVQR